MLTVDANVWISATDSTDQFYRPSRACLAIAAQQNRRFYLPSIAWVEVPCVLARRMRNPRTGTQLATKILGQPGIQRVEMDLAIIRVAADVGPRLRIRGADALYVAVALHSGSQLLSWDRELVERAGAATPLEWLSRQTKG